jgi:hypothetical protein
MANEGEYPKIDGDVLYASEINKVSKLSSFFAAGSIINTGSSTDIREIGSVVIPGGTFIGNYAMVDVYAYNNVAPGAGSVGIGISGIAGSGNLDITIDSGHTNTKICLSHEPNNCSIVTDHIRNLTPNTANRAYATGFNTNLGSDLVIFFRLVTNATNPSYFNPYIVHGYSKLY